MTPEMRSTAASLPIGQILLREKLISEPDLQAALEQQSQSKELLGAVLLKRGLLDEEHLFPLLALQLGVEYVDLKKVEIPTAVLSRVPAQFASHYKAIPIRSHNGHLTVALSDPRDILKIDELSATLRSTIDPVIAGERAILESIRRYYGLGAETIERMLANAPERMLPREAAESLDELTSEASIGSFVNQLILEAYREGATDIHIEPTAEGLAVRYRVDGFLRDAKVPKNLKHFKDPINSRIKILSHLNIAEKRLPQDGRFNVKTQDGQLDLRVSFLPTAFGESLVIRILNPNQLFDLKELGLSSRDQNALDGLIRRPHGIVFVTGPTGSGKTTTLYSCLSRLNDPDTKILTIEDPVEYQLNGITQIQVNPAIGLTFAQGLRSMLRHDPDIMMVGEVRDHETAEIAVQVALTGHLVFSTLHTNDAVSGITRLLDMGIEPYLLSSSVICFMAQRLVRVACPKCKQPAKEDSDLLKNFNLKPEDLQSAVLVAAKGCRDCKFTGYQGRKGIYEFLVLDEELRQMIHDRTSAGEIRSRAVQKGMITLRQDGWEKVRTGLTTPEEVIRVTQEET